MAFIIPSIPDVDGALSVSITLNIVLRVIVIIWMLDLTKTYRLSQGLWLILGLIFSGWALIAINIVIWNKPVRSSKPTDEDVLDAQFAETKEEQQDERQASGNKGAQFAICPACNFALKGGEEKCPDCGLSLLE